MATKKNNETPVVTINSEKILEEENQREFIILEGAIKDDFCHFKYEVIKGVGRGFQHSVKGDGVIMDDMREAFSKFNVHMAVMDDVFKHAGIDIMDIEQCHGEELTGLFTCTGFKIKSSGTMDSIVLVGNKWVSGGGRIEFETPRVPMDNLSSYKWWNELKTASDNAREEVALYMEGKYEVAELDPEEEKKKDKTGNLFDQQIQNDKADQEFENAAL